MVNLVGYGECMYPVGWGTFGNMYVIVGGAQQVYK